MSLIKLRATRANRSRRSFRKDLRERMLSLTTVKSDSRGPWLLALHVRIHMLLITNLNSKFYDKLNSNQIHLTFHLQ